jgi:hypothetical protein
LVNDARKERTTTLAVVGIAATALVGLVGSGLAFLSSREDRNTQLAVAQDNRVFDRRATVYLDAIDFVEVQKEQFISYRESEVGEHIAYTEDPPRSLNDRLIAFGSSRAFKAFHKVEDETDEVEVKGIDSIGFDKNGLFIARHDSGVPRDFNSAEAVFEAQVARFEQVVAQDLR